MSGPMEIQESNRVAVAVWTKGFAVTRESPEFQMIIPPKKGDLEAIERVFFDRPDWSSVLNGLYPLTDRDLAHERCLLVTAEDALLAIPAPMLDRHGRRVVAVCTARLEVDWADPDLSLHVARAHGLAVRLLDTYTTTLSSKSNSKVERLLQKGEFLPDRTFDINEEGGVAHEEWARTLDAVRAVRGVVGVATPRMISLGANVLLGTHHEAEVARVKGADVDGYLEPRAGRIDAISTAISPWMRRPVVPPPSRDLPEDMDEPPEVQHERARASRRQVDRSLEEAQRASHNVIDAWFRVFAHFVDRLW